MVISVWGQTPRLAIEVVWSRLVYLLPYSIDLNPILVQIGDGFGHKGLGQINLGYDNDPGQDCHIS